MTWKSMDFSNKKVSNRIPNDLVSPIISKSSLKPLNRFKCVCKSWALLLESPYFKNMYFKKFISNSSCYNDTYLLLKQNMLDSEKRSLLYLFYTEGFDKVKLNWPLPLMEHRNINIFGSGINGTLCLYGEGFHPKVVVWNPILKEFNIIPYNPTVYVPQHAIVSIQLHGFGYDYFRDDYKVIRYVDFLTNPDLALNPLIDVISPKLLYAPLWEIYSLKSNSWRRLDFYMPTINQSPTSVLKQMYFNGVCHWLGKSEIDNDNVYLVSFGLGSEVFWLTSIPSFMDDDVDFKKMDTHLMLLNESIALISTNAQMYTFHISILGEIGVKESWTKLLTIGPLPCVRHPIGIGKNGDIFFIKEDEELVRYDLYSHTIQEFNIKGVTLGSQIVIYTL